MRVLLHAGLVVLLTITTQVGGLAWLIALFTRWRLPAFVLAYGALSLGAYALSPRVPLPCFGGPLKVQAIGYCLANRHYVDPELRDALTDIGAQMEVQFPGTQTLVLDGNFPLFDGFPLLPHLSHDDGDKADLAFFYTRDGAYAPGVTRSPFGYFAFEEGATDCPKAFPTLRWDFAQLQPFWRNMAIEPERTRALLVALLEEPRIGKVLLEPHLQKSLGLSDPKLRFQGCRAARHDDHIHLQL